MGHPAQRARLCDGAIGAGVEHDGILPVGHHKDQSMPRGRIGQARHMPDPNPIPGQRLQRPVPVRPDCPEMLHIGARPRRRHRLVGTLAAEPPHQRGGWKGFAGRRKVGHGVGEIRVD